MDILRRDGGRQAGRDAALSPQRAHSQARGHVRIALYDRSQKGETQRNANGLLIVSENPQRLVEYYTKLFGKPNWDEGGYVGWQIGSGSVTIAAHDQVKGKNTTPGRLIWNIETADVKGQFEKFKTAGATVVKEPYQMGEAPGQDVAIASFAALLEPGHAVADDLGRLRRSRLDRLAKRRQRNAPVLRSGRDVVVDGPCGFRGHLPCRHPRPPD